MKALLGYSAASWLSAIIGFLAIPLATHSFSQEVIGQLNLILTSAILLQTIALMGLDQGYMRHYFGLENKAQQSALLGFCTLLPIFVTAILAMFIFLLDDQISDFFAADGNSVCFTLILAVLALVAVRMAVCYYRAGSRLMQFICFSVCFTILSKCPYLLNFGDKGLLQTLDVMSLAFLCAALISLAMLLPSAFKCSRSDMHTINRAGILRYSIPMMPAMLLSSLNAYVPSFAIRMIAGYGDLGIYSMAATISSVVGIISAGVNSFWPTYVYEHYSDRHETVRMFHKALTMALYVLGSLLIMLRFLVPLFLGSGYEDASALFAVLVISPICYSIGETSGVGIQIAKRSRVYLAIYAAGLILNIILAVLLTSLFGMFGAAVSVTIVGAAMLAAKTIIGNRYYDSIGSHRWWLTCVGLLVIQSAVAASVSYPISVVIFVLGIVLYPFVVGVKEFKETVFWIFGYLKRGAAKS